MSGWFFHDTVSQGNNIYNILLNKKINIMNIT